MSDADSLETFAPVPCEVRAGGRTLEILPLRLRALPRFSQAVQPVLPALMAGDLQAAIQQHQEGLVRAVAIATGTEEDWLGELWPDEFVRVARAVLEVNVDFFGRRVIPELSAAADSLTGKMTAFRGAGSSPGSDSADTTSTPASD